MFIFKSDYQWSTLRYVEKIVLGSTGMLGHAVYRELKKSSNQVFTYRLQSSSANKSFLHFDFGSGDVKTGRKNTILLSHKFDTDKVIKSFMKLINVTKDIAPVNPNKSNIFPNLDKLRFILF